MQKQKLEQKISNLNLQIQKVQKVKNLPLVSVLKLKPQKFQHFLKVQADVKTFQNILLYSEFPAKILQVFVKEGQRVRKNQLLAKVDDGGLRNQVQQVKVQMELAKTTSERQERLWAKKIGSELQFLQAKTQYEALKNQLKQLKKQLQKTNIKAPFDGIIDVVFKKKGNLVSMGKGGEIFRILNLSKMYVESEISEKYIFSVKKGSSVKIEFPFLQKEIETQIQTVGNFINPNNRTFQIQIPIENPEENIKPNLFAKLQINDYTNENAILIPQSIILQNAKQQHFVFVATKEKNKIAVAQKTFIQMGKNQNGFVEILKGLTPEMKVIEDGAKNILPHQKVRIK